MILAVAAAGAAPATASAAGATVVLNRGNAGEPDTLDPHLATGSWESNIIADMFVGLTTDDIRGEPIPGLAVSWTTSGDGLVWTFALRPGAKWSDGAPVTAGDVVFGLRRAVDPATAAQYASLLYLIKNAEAVNRREATPDQLGVRAIDAMTVEIVLAHPAPYLPQLLSHYASFPVPRHIVEKFGDQWTKPDNIATSGPYVLAEWVPNDHIRVVKNPFFYEADQVQIDEVNFYPTDDAESALKRFRAGELDLNVGFPSAQIDWLRANLPAETRVATFVNIRRIIFNTKRPPFDDIRVRQALSLAIEREVIAGRILKAGEQPAYSMVPPGIAGYPGTAELRFRNLPMEERLTRARDLLAQAGFGPGNPLRFQFNYIADLDSRRVSAALQDMWKRVGAEAELIVSEKRVHYNTLRIFDFAVAESNWIADFNDAKNFLFLLQPSSGEMNVSQYSNMQYEEIMDRADATLDPVARAALMVEAEQLSLDESPDAPIYFGVSRALVHTYVKGWVDNLSNVHRTRYLRIERGPAQATAE